MTTSERITQDPNPHNPNQHYIDPRVHNSSTETLDALRTPEVAPGESIGSRMGDAAVRSINGPESFGGKLTKFIGGHKIAAAAGGLSLTVGTLLGTGAVELNNPFANNRAGAVAPDVSGSDEAPREGTTYQEDPGKYDLGPASDSIDAFRARSDYEQITYAVPIIEKELPQAEKEINAYLTSKGRPTINVVPVSENNSAQEILDQWAAISWAASKNPDKLEAAKTLSAKFALSSAGLDSETTKLNNGKGTILDAFVSQGSSANFRQSEFAGFNPGGAVTKVIVLEDPGTGEPFNVIAQLHYGDANGNNPTWRQIETIDNDEYGFSSTPQQLGLK